MNRESLKKETEQAWARVAAAATDRAEREAGLLEWHDRSLRWAIVVWLVVVVAYVVVATLPT